MAIRGQSSFRRMLLSRILLLSIPILLLGVAVTFRKARTSLLYTARQNLVESATRKADTIASDIEALKTGLAIAGESQALRSGSLEDIDPFLEHLLPNLPTDVICLQLQNVQTHQPVASTCGSTPLAALPIQSWPTQRGADGGDRFQTYTLQADITRQVRQPDLESQLALLISAPVYDATNQLRYRLTAQTVVRQIESAAPWSLLGYTVVIDEDGTFLAHPLAEKVGTTIAQETDRDRFEDILDNSLRSQSTVRHLFNFSGDNSEWLAGFSPITVPVSVDESRTWTVLAVTPLDHALQGLEAITQILFILTTGLLAAHLLAMLYMARDLSRPIEQLGKYARNIHTKDPVDRAPKNFRIRELNQLSVVLDTMVCRLEERARELESAWQEAEAANQLKSEFLANTSHELRTPLNAIIGCIRLVQDGCCDTREEEHEFLAQADKAAVHLLKIINDLLDIRRIEERALPLCLEVLDVRLILKEVAELQAVQIQQKGLELLVEHPSVPILVQADPARLKQVLLNVIYNATKFTDRGGITIRATVNGPIHPSHTAVPTNSNGSGNGNQALTSWVIITVQDTGIGIEPSQQQKLFRPFVMVDGTTTRKFEGTGLGLAISRNLIEMMGGSITLYSEGLNMGTTVEIVLPIAESTVSVQADHTQETPASVS